MRILMTGLFVVSLTAAGIAQAQSTGSWVARSDAPVPGFGFGSASDATSFYVFGGSVIIPSGSNAPSNGAKKYDPSTDRWTDLSPLPYANAFSCGAYASGSIYSFGGSATGGAILRYEIASGLWSSVGSLPDRVIASATPLNGKIYVTGGLTAMLGGTALTDHIEFDPATGTVRSRAQMPTALSGHASAGIEALRHLYVFGGTSSSRQSYATATGSAFKYDVANDLWSTVAPIRSGGASGTRTLSSAFVFGSRIYLAAGVGTGIWADTTLEYDPTADTWTDRAPSGVARAWGASGVVGGKAYVSGGQGPTGIIASTMEFTPPDLTPTALNVRQAGVLQGGSTNFPIRFEADLQSAVATDRFSWQIQVKAPGDADWPAGITMSTALLPQGPVGLNYTNVAAGGYDWRHRIVDAIGIATPWIEFNVATPDFTFAAPPLPVPVVTPGEDPSTARGNCSAGARSSGGFLGLLVIAILAAHGRSGASRPVHPAH